MSGKPKRALILTGKVVLLTVVLMFLSGIGSRLLPASFTGAGEGIDSAAPDSAAPADDFMVLILAVMFVQVVALAFPIVRARWSGRRLVGTIFLVHFGTGTFLNQIESLVYLDGKMPEGFVSGLFAMGLFTAALFSPVAVVTLGRWKAAPAAGASDFGSDSKPVLGRRAWRVPVAGVIFLALYYLFGYYVAWQSPELRAYYGGTDPGSFLAQMGSVVRATPWMLPLQFARGLGWVALGLLLIRSMRGPWWHQGLATALVFAAPCLYLLLPNPIFPDAVRMLHFAETLPYQFLFGLFLGWFFRARPEPVASPSAVRVG